MDDWLIDLAPCPPEMVERLRAQLGVGEVLAQILVRRGLGEPADARAFLAAREHHEPSEFNGIDEAVELLARHVRAGKRITVHGDYDADGVCATAVLVRALRRLDADVDSYIPDRAEGYGLSAATVRALAARGTALIVTVDCAIGAADEVALARDLGLDVIVTDHHAAAPGARLPDAPIVHPALCGYPFPSLCGTAVAYKLAQALESEWGADPAGRRGDHDLVAIATIADVVPLVGENRALVRYGLRALARTAKPGLRALMAGLSIDAPRVDERDVAFRIAPRLNAAGRLFRADAALELLLCEERGRALQIAQELDRANHERREIEAVVYREAAAQLSAAGDAPAYVLAGEGWHAGVIGIVASRLAERSGRPVLLVALEEGRGRGSGRSVPGVDLLAALHDCAELMERYGGHAGAAGLELDAANIPALAEAFAAAVRSVAGADAPPVERVDAVLDVADIGLDLAEELAALAPFGAANPAPCLLVKDATFVDVQEMGEGRHARFTVAGARGRARAVSFGSATLPVAEGRPACATFTLELNEWNGVVEPRLVLRRASESAEYERAAA